MRSWPCLSLDILLLEQRLKLTLLIIAFPDNYFFFYLVGTASILRDKLPGVNSSYLSSPFVFRECAEEKWGSPVMYVPFPALSSQQCDSGHWESWEEGRMRTGRWEGGCWVSPVPPWGGGWIFTRWPMTLAEGSLFILSVCPSPMVLVPLATFAVNSCS